MDTDVHSPIGGCTSPPGVVVLQWSCHLPGSRRILNRYDIYIYFPLTKQIVLLNFTGVDPDFVFEHGDLEGACQTPGSRSTRPHPFKNDIQFSQISYKNYAAVTAHRKWPEWSTGAWEYSNFNTVGYIIENRLSQWLYIMS